MKIVKPGAEHDTPRGILGGAELSQATTGATNIYMAKFRVPPGARSRPHYHANCESGLYMLSGRIAIHWGEHLEQTLEVEPGDLLYVPPRETHVVVNLSDDEPADYVVARDSPTEDSVEVPWADEGQLWLGDVGLDGALEARRLLAAVSGRPRRWRSQCTEPHSPTTSRQPSRRLSISSSEEAVATTSTRPPPGVPSCCMRYSSPVWATHAARKRGACQSSPSHHRPRSCSREMSRRLSAA